MSSDGQTLSIRVVETVAKAVGKDSTELPPLEDTISADALDLLFDQGASPVGAFTVFPYYGVWVLVHGQGTVDVFEDFMATSAEEELPPDASAPSTDDPLVILAAEDDRYALHGDDLAEVHAIMDDAEDSSEAWAETLEYAEEQ